MGVPTIGGQMCDEQGVGQEFHAPYVIRTFAAEKVSRFAKQIHPSVPAVIRPKTMPYLSENG